MKRKPLRILLTVLTLLLLLALQTGAVFADAGYDTERFDVSVTVEENHVIHVSERIAVDFWQAKHGIYRYIPYSPGIYTIKHVEVEDDDYETETVTEDDVTRKIIKIGDADRTITGEHIYRISYDLVGYADKDGTMDYLSLDLLPTEWETAIDHTSITMTLPEPVSAESLELYSGTYGAEGNDAAIDYDYDEDSGTLTIEADDLEKGVGITVRADLPEGYWENATSRDWLVYPAAGLLILVPLVAFLLWLLFGRDPKIVKTVEFYPPEGLTPAEIGYVLDGTVDTQDLVSMIMYYAQKGWVTIHEYKKNKFEIEKVAEIGKGEKAFSKTFFRSIFAKGNVARLDQLPATFGDGFLAAKSQLRGWYCKDRALYTLSSIICRIIGMMLIFVPPMASIVFGALLTFEDVLLVLFLPVILLLFGGLVLLLLSYDKKDVYKRRKRTVMMGLSLLFLMAGTGIAVAVFVVALDSWLMGILLIVSTVVTAVFVTLMQARTKYSARLTGQILGFKDFIEQAELDKLNMMVEENPSYFYDVLPYAYVMGLSDKWARKFKNIKIPSPTWYTGYGTDPVFNAIWYSHMMRSCTKSFADGTIKSIAKATGETLDKGGGSIGGGFGGGGFSGGGFGGGGGGSW